MVMETMCDSIFDHIAELLHAILAVWRQVFGLKTGRWHCLTVVVSMRQNERNYELQNSCGQLL